MNGYASTDPLTGGNVNSGKSPTFPTSLCKSKTNSFRRSLKSRNKTEVATVIHKVTLTHCHFLDLSSPPASVRLPQWRPDLKYMKEIKELPRGKLTKSRKDDNNQDTQLSTGPLCTGPYSSPWGEGCLPAVGVTMAQGPCQRVHGPLNSLPQISIPLKPASGNAVVATKNHDKRCAALSGLSLRRHSCADLHVPA